MKHDLILKEIKALEAQLKGENPNKKELNEKLINLKKKLKSIEYEVEFGL